MHQLAGAGAFMSLCCATLCVIMAGVLHVYAPSMQQASVLSRVVTCCVDAVHVDALIAACMCACLCAHRSTAP